MKNLCETVAVTHLLSRSGTRATPRGKAIGKHPEKAGLPERSRNTQMLLNVQRLRNPAGRKKRIGKKVQKWKKGILKEALLPFYASY